MPQEMLQNVERFYTMKLLHLIARGIEKVYFY